MGLCYNSTFLNIIMYIKYIILFSFVILFIYSFLKKGNIYVKKISKILLFILLIFYGLMIVFNLLNLKIKYCFNNSNPYKLYYTSKLYNAYNSDNIYFSFDASSDTIKPTEERDVVNKEYKLKIFNINYYPLSDINFTLTESSKSMNMKDSGVEIATLATIISSLNSYSREINPIDILQTIKYSENMDKSFNMDNLLYILNEEYDFNYLEISPDQIDDALDRSGIILVKVHGAESGTIFTCSDSYIIIYNQDKDLNYYIVNVNDKDFDNICKVNTNGFGNVVKANQNNSYYSYQDIIENSERYYVLWR